MEGCASEVRALFLGSMSSSQVANHSGCPSKGLHVQSKEWGMDLYLLFCAGSWFLVQGVGRRVKWC